jgi:hypothetical protein
MGIPVNIKPIIYYGTYSINYLSLPKVTNQKVSFVQAIILYSLIMVGLKATALS